MKLIKKALCFCMAVMLAWTALSATEKSNVKAASAGTVTMSVEKFTLGQGYLIEPTKVTFQAGENVAQVFDRLMKQKGYTYTNTGRLTESFYLASIDKADTGKLDIPSCIQKMPPSVSWDGTKVYPPSNTVNTGNIEFPTLGEFAYSSQSGWYYFVNHIPLGVGMSDTKAKAGDVIRIQFTVYGLGADLGAGMGGNSAALPIPNRDVATDKMAVMNANPNGFKNPTWKKAYDQAVKVVSDMDSSKAQIDAAAKALPTVSQINKWVQEQKLIKKYTPKKTSLKSVKKAGKGKMKLTWKKESGCTGYQVYMSTKKSSGYKNIKTITKNKTVSYTKTKLKKGKTYYFKIRTYKKVGKKTYFGSYSNVKNLKMK